MTGCRIFVVEDDAGIADATKSALEKWGFDAKCAENFADVMSEFSSFDPQLVLLDIMLPLYNGYYWCDAIRKVSNVPVIFISSASDSMNIIMAMEKGGDDFIAKPFDLSVLTAKINALLRRTYDYTPIQTISHNGLTLNMSDSSFTVEGVRCELSKNEYRILLTLMENRGTVVSREKLMIALWNTDSFIDDNTLTVNINRLRKKLGAVGMSDYIITRHGMGYQIEK